MIYTAIRRLVLGTCNDGMGRMGGGGKVLLLRFEILSGVPPTPDSGVYQIHGIAHSGGIEMLIGQLQYAAESFGKKKRSLCVTSK